MGWLYPRTTNPPGATADGPALAARAGAALADLELVQFHPTALALGDGPLPLVSEAVRGEGAVLRDARGRRFMPDEHPMAELGPARRRRARDRPAGRRVWAREVTLDLRHLDPEAVRRRFPTVAAMCAEHGLDLARDPIPVTPAAHYAIGGVLADMAGRTTLPGLFAVGECAATGAHGANRLASNGLLEAAVLAAGAADALAGDRDAWPEWPAAAASAPPPERGGGAPAREALQAAMWRGVGVERDAEGIARARRALAALPEGADAGTDNLLLVARLAAEAAGLRAESRGAHFRRDHPLPDPAQAHRIAWAGGSPFTSRRPLSPGVAGPLPRRRHDSHRTGLRPARRRGAPGRAARARLGGEGRPRLARRHPRPPLPEGRGHRVRRRDRRLVPPGPPRRGRHRGGADRVPRRVLHGRGRRRAEVPGPDGRAAGPGRRLPPGRVR